MKSIKYLVAGLLMMVLSAPAMAQDVDYKTMLKPIEEQLKAKQTDTKDFKNLVKDYKKEFKKNPEALVALGNAFVMEKDFVSGEECANLAISRDKTYGDAYILLGNIKALQDDGGEAAMWYQQCMTMDPKNPQGYMSYANVYRKIDPAESARTLEKLRQVLPDFPYEAEAGHNFYAGGNYEQAYNYFKQGDKSKFEEYILAEYAVTCYMLDKKDESLEIAKFGMQKFPKDVTFHRVALWSATDTEKYPEAIAYANTVINVDTVEQSQRDVVYYGLALKGNAKYEEAIAQFQKALEMNAEDYTPLQYISDAYKGAGNEDKALEYSKLYLEKNPSAKISDYNSLADIYLQKVKKGTDSLTKVNDLKQAIAVYDGLATKYPQIATWAHIQKADAAFQVEFDDIALDLYKQSITELENKADRDEDETGYLKRAYRNVGYIYWASKNDLNSATPYFEKLIKLDPENAMAKQALGLDQPQEAAEGEQAAGAGQSAAATQQ